MSILRFASICLLGVAGIGTASAQSATKPADPSVSPLHIPAYTHAPALITWQSDVPKVQFQIPRTARVQVQMAQNDSPCYTMRSYGFTRDDLNSNSPKPSSSTTCTPRAGAMLKGAGVAATK
jgi:hypothetical protein